METSIGSALMEILVPLARRETISGVMIGERIVDTVVIPTENATSPPQRYDMILDDTPPGQQPTRMSPSAMPAGRCSTFVSANARNGIIRYCANAPTQISNGLCARILNPALSVSDPY